MGAFLRDFLRYWRPSRLSLLFIADRLKPGFAVDAIVKFLYPNDCVVVFQGPKRRRR